MFLEQFSTLVTIPDARSSENLSVIANWPRLGRAKFAITERFSLESASGIVTSVENCSENVYRPRPEL